ncbi:Protein of unknown function [Octadecabacter temperatus]|uniref:Uncharacterized protein n=1 Tax=Octadecabacter temperatus TaxID=1458307 RepID=A0A0K0Y105_9RHOB|nr:DUF262 domain-containing protein [Octadecabacter temperatus]AKS44582.1 hypothetical protein OSB_00130 [Octadecabacter temperatus]SIO37858.1 Protein of unknown function [Octadecabacter temperatus]
MADEVKPVSTYSPNKETISQLLSMTEPSIVVPDWQRNYSWKTDQVETFWNDLVRFSERQTDKVKTEYFLGSVVIVRTQDGLLKLLDGQQRLATSAILISVIRDYVSKHSKDAAAQLQKDYLVGFDHLENKTVHKLRLNIYDRDFFRQLVLDERNADYSEPEPKISSHHLILNTRKKFEAYLAKFVEGLAAEDGAKKSLGLSRCLLRQMTVIAVHSTDEDSAADVFETLNDRGIGLSTPDLLRNLVIRRAPEGQEDTVVELWKDLISFENDAQIQNFLRHYWVSRYGDVKTQSLYREIKGVILDKDLESVRLSTSMNTSSDVYRQILGANTSSMALNKILTEVLEYGSRARILLPTILALIEVVGAEEATDPVHLVHNAFVRYSIIRNLENSPFESAMYEAARELHEKKDVAAFCEKIRGVAPDDESTEASFRGLSISHNGSRRNILKRFELSLRKTEELEIAGTKDVHVEHVYPQKPLAGEKMANHDRVINRIGNLTLLSARLNRQIQNGNFESKKPELAKSELLMTQEIAVRDDWNEEAINERQHTMASLAPDLWQV